MKKKSILPLALIAIGALLTTGSLLWRGSPQLELKVQSANFIMPAAYKVYENPEVLGGRYNLTDHCYMITGNLVSGGNLIHQIQKVFFPEGAYDIKQDKDTFDNAVFTYKLDVEESRFPVSLLTGIALMLGGGVWLLLQKRLPQRKMGVAGLLFLPLLMIGCSRNNEPSRQELLANMTSQLCTDVRGVQALFWDMNNGILRGDIPGGVPTIKNPGAYYIHSGYPALGFQMPQGYRAVELSGGSTIGVNVLRNDDNALWRYVTTSFFGTTNANQVLQSEINQMATNLGINAQNISIVCSNAGSSQVTSDIQITTSTALMRAGNFTALFAVNVTTFASTNSSFAGIQMTLGPTAEYDQLVLDTFLPISYQLLFIDRESVVDSDGDGVPDGKDRAPFDPTIQ